MQLKERILASLQPPEIPECFVTRNLELAQQVSDLQSKLRYLESVVNRSLSDIDNSEDTNEEDNDHGLNPIVCPNPSEALSEGRFPLVGSLLLVIFIIILWYSF